MVEGEGEPLVGRTIVGKYLVERLLGRGGMGAVYAAHQVALDKRVAIKVLNEHVARDDAFVRRFQREARAASRLDHPNSVHILDFGQDESGLLYIVMEHLDGRNLGSVLDEEHPFDERRIAMIIAQILAALMTAHELGVVHRDLKPENVMLLRRVDDDGRSIDHVKVCDFGIATLTSNNPDEDATLTSQGIILGTPEYMSPEQARGEALDARTDIYSVGVILYELLTGEPPFRAESALGVALRQVNDPVRPPSQLVASIDPQLERICMRALEKQRDRRWASAREMRSQLRSFLEARGSTLPPPPTMRGGVRDATRELETLAELAREPDRPRHALRGGAFALALAIGALAVALTVSSRRGPEPSAPLPPPPVSETATPAATPLATYAVIAANPAPAVDSAPASKPTPVVTVRRKAEAAAPEPIVSVAPPPVENEAPAPPPVTVAPVVTAPPPIVVAPKPIDAANAHVTIDAVTATSGLPASSVRAALAHVPLTRCYREALVGRTTPARGTATLRLSIDDTGHIVGATLDGAKFLPAVRGCVESAAKSALVKNVDTGDASASVTLTFGHP